MASIYLSPGSGPRPDPLAVLASQLRTLRDDSQVRADAEHNAEFTDGFWSGRVAGLQTALELLAEVGP